MSMLIDFRSLVTQYANCGAPYAHLIPSELNSFPSCACPDQWLNWQEGSDFFVRQVVDPKCPLRDPAVILVLESPHKDEFIRNEAEWTAIGPANGDTGRKFRRHIKTVMAARMPTADIPWLFVNAVQHQTSLGRAVSQYPLNVRRKLRNGLFQHCWERGGETDFRRRIRAYYRPGDLLVNACTGEKTQPSQLNLKMLIEKAITSEFSSKLHSREVDWGNKRQVVSHLGVYHPSSWGPAKQLQPIWCG